MLQCRDSLHHHQPHLSSIKQPVTVVWTRWREWVLPELFTSREEESVLIINLRYLLIETTINSYLIHKHVYFSYLSTRILAYLQDGPDQFRSLLVESASWWFMIVKETASETRINSSIISGRVRHRMGDLIQVKLTFLCLEKLCRSVSSNCDDI